MNTSPHRAPVLLNGEWQSSAAVDSFCAHNPACGQALDVQHPVSPWNEVDAALDAASSAFAASRQLPPGVIPDFLRRYADRIEAHADEICQAAALETGLPLAPRLKDIELPRTTGQLRQAANAAENGAWRLPTVDAEAGIRSVLEPLGPVVVFGPNNFPLAFNGISGGDFAAAVAAGNPVIAKAHPLHPTTSRLLAECAHDAATACGLPPGFIQMLYAMSNDDGLKLVADPRVGATAFTGSRQGGLALKAAADATGKPIYLELSSINPVVLLPGALAERGEDIATELTTSALMAAGQFCTNPGIVLALAGPDTNRLAARLTEDYTNAPCGTLLGKDVMDGVSSGIDALVEAGASLHCGGTPAAREGFAWSNTLLKVSARDYLAAGRALQREVFGNVTLIVIADELDDVSEIISQLEGNLTGSIYSATDGVDDAAYDALAPILRPKVGRLINDKMPTGVAVSPAMNHGGPFPATGHPHFTAVGLPGAMRRFTMLACYDNVRQHRLPAILQD